MDGPDIKTFNPVVKAFSPALKANNPLLMQKPGGIYIYFEWYLNLKRIYNWLQLQINAQYKKYAIYLENGDL